MVYKVFSCKKEGRKRPLWCAFLSALLVAGLLAGCGGQSRGNRVSSSQPPHSVASSTVTSSSSNSSAKNSAAVISAAELSSLETGGKVSLADASPASILWEAQNDKVVSSEIAAWLRQATPYKGTIPHSQEPFIIKANIEPCRLLITTTGNHKISIQPAFYITSQGDTIHVQLVTDVLLLNNDGRKSYIASVGLFDWLSKGQWQSEFKMA